MDKLKEILFGFIVIASLGVIFLPMLFTERHHTKEKVVSTPDKPTEHRLAETKHDHKHKHHKKHLNELNENHEEPTKPVVVKQDVHDKYEITAMDPAPEPITAIASSTTPKVAHAEVPAPMPEPIAIPEPKAVNTEPTPEAVITAKKPKHEIKEKAKAPIEKKSPVKRKNTVKTKGLTVQVGTFAVHENALHLVQKLKRAGYPAYTKNLNRSGRDLTVVLVGPYSGQDAAVQSVMNIQQRYGLRGEILHFSPSQTTLEEDDQ